jgi:hypothetical protein
MSNLIVGPFAADVEKLALACVFDSGRIYAGGRLNIYSDRSKLSPICTTRTY